VEIDMVSPGGLFLGKVRDITAACQAVLLKSGGAPKNKDINQVDNLFYDLWDTHVFGQIFTDHDYSYLESLYLFDQTKRSGRFDSWQDEFRYDAWYCTMLSAHLFVLDNPSLFDGRAAVTHMIDELAAAYPSFSDTFRDYQRTDIEIKRLSGILEALLTSYSNKGYDLSDERNRWNQLQPSLRPQTQPPSLGAGQARSGAKSMGAKR
jgi:hypothetical protein